MHEVTKATNLIRKYDMRLFCKWNDKTECMEIWEHGKKGKDHLVRILEEDGHFRPLDYKDIEEIHKRNIAFRNEGILEEIDSVNRDFKHKNDNAYKKDIRRISTDNFNQIMKNPVITGDITVNP